MVENKNKKADKLTDSEKKKIKQENKAKANPKQAEEKKAKNDSKREKRAVSVRSSYQSPLRLLPRAVVTPHLINLSHQPVSSTCLINLLPLDGHRCAQESGSVKTFS